MAIGDRRGLSREAKTALEYLRYLGRTIPLKPPPDYKGSVSQYKYQRAVELGPQREEVLDALRDTLERNQRQERRRRGERINDPTWPAETPPDVFRKADDQGPGFTVLPESQYSQTYSTADLDDPQTTPNSQVVDDQEVTDDTKRHQMEPAACALNEGDPEKIQVTLDAEGVRVAELPPEIREFFKKNPRKEVWVRGMAKGPGSKQMIIDVPEGVTEEELLFYIPWCGRRDMTGRRIYMMPDDTDIIIRQKGWDGQIYTRLYTLPDRVEIRDMYGSQHMPKGRINPMELLAAHRITPAGDLIIYVDNSVLDEIMNTSSGRLEDTDDRDVQLLRCERVLALQLRWSLEAGKALQKIRQQQLYSGRDMTFMQYCRTFWGISRAHADRLISYVEVVEILRPVASAKVLCHEGQLRPLTKVRKADGTLDANTIRLLWNRVVRVAVPARYQLAPGKKAPEGMFPGLIITARDVDAVVRQDYQWRGDAFAKCKAKVVRKTPRKPEVVVRLNTEDPDSTAVLMFQTFERAYLVKLVVRLLKFFKKPAPHCSWER